jgi:hypothetical protein
VVVIKGFDKKEWKPADEVVDQDSRRVH